MHTHTDKTLLYSNAIALSTFFYIESSYGVFIWHPKASTVLYLWFEQKTLYAFIVLYTIQCTLYSVRGTICYSSIGVEIELKKKIDFFSSHQTYIQNYARNVCASKRSVRRLSVTESFTNRS